MLFRSDDVARMRQRAVDAVTAVYQRLGLAEFTPEWADQAVDAAGSKDIPAADLMLPLTASQRIMADGITMLDVITALAESGFTTEAQRCLDLLKARIAGDYLQTAAIFDESMQPLSLVTDPNDYAGPGTGYRPTPQRQAEIDQVRQAKSVADIRAEQDGWRTGGIIEAGPAVPSSDPREVVIGVSPATGRAIWRTLSGLSVEGVLDELLTGLEQEGCHGRVVRINETVDLGMIGLTAARMSGSGVSIGLQAKGTALIHRRDLAPLANLELYSVAPTLDRQLYRQLGINAARHAHGVTPEIGRAHV